jgi:three-Cys-motif partner protein
MTEETSMAVEDSQTTAPPSASSSGPYLQNATATATATYMTKEFGGLWTKQKLDIIEDYLVAYLQVMKNQRSRFRLGYMDAFAGDGDIRIRGTEEGQLIQGSAFRALTLDPGFDTYVFVDRDPDAVRSLESLKAEFGQKDIRIRQGDGNLVLQELQDRDWRRHRAVVFLDPTGMQVDWATLEALAETEAVDVWIWFPLGIGLNRMLIRTGDIPDDWGAKIDRVLGTKNWREAFYASDPQRTLFPEPDQGDRLIKTATLDSIGRYFIDRLRTIFPLVSAKPRPMFNSTGNPLYLLCFAAANKKAYQALTIADHLLTRI